jgi:quercetin dioxygenase-like cupin family protein
MYDGSDPRSKLADAGPPKPAATTFAGAEYAKFYENDPQESGPDARTWYVRGQNYVVAYTEAQAGAVLARQGHPDEYALILPDAAARITVSAGTQSERVAGNSVAFVPPGDSRIVLDTAARIVRLFTLRSEDLAAKCSNAGSFAQPHPNIPPFEPWPVPPDGYRMRAYSLDVPSDGGRFGRIFRCTTFMINYLDARMGPRDVTKLSPHFHDDFEQCSLVLDGSYIHDIRWPWTTNMNNWREDDHEFCGAPSIAIIPPPAIHTSRAVGDSLNQMVDIFCPPRVDFSKKPGWVLNERDYPV